MRNVVSVEIVMLTYNEEKFVSQAIDSVLEQDCEFPFLLVIFDDCSTDNTAAICQDYALKFPQKIHFTQNKENLGLIKNYRKALDFCTAKYIAILEGDDYWIDKCKLQKQVELLESDSELGLVHTARQTLINETQKIHKTSTTVTNFHRKNQGFVFNTLLLENFITPLTVLFRHKAIIAKLDFDYFINNDFKTLDYAIWLAITKENKIAFMEDETGVYRIRRDSIMNKKSIQSLEIFLQTSRLTCKYYIEKFNVKEISATCIDDFYNNFLFSHSLLYGDSIYSKKYANIIKKNSLKDWLKYFISKSDLSIFLYSKFLNRYFVK
jgi:glycosyltransferase involved in cell wall biosynthesis